MLISRRSSAGVPLVDLAPVHADLKAAIIAGIEDVIDASAFTDGRQVAGFESAFAAYCGREHGVGVSQTV